MQSLYELIYGKQFIFPNHDMAKIRHINREESDSENEELQTVEISECAQPLEEPVEEEEEEGGSKDKKPIKSKYDEQKRKTDNGKKNKTTNNNNGKKKKKRMTKSHSGEVPPPFFAMVTPCSIPDHKLCQFLQSMTAAKRRH